MTWLSVAFIAAGLADLLRAKELRNPRWLPHVVSLATFAVLAPLTGLTDAGDGLALVVLAGVVSAWVVTSERTQRNGRRPLLPLLVLGGGALLALAFSGFASPVSGPFARWLAWADLPGPISASPSAGHILLVVGLGLANLSTANVIVRLVLLAMNAMRPEAHRSATSEPEPADTLRGGRLLGPLERLLIFGLGLAGEFGAAGLVIAAKGLLRFPEIQATTKAAAQTVTPGARAARAASNDIRVGNGIDDVTEYFLIGSFVSWIVALASLALVR